LPHSLLAIAAATPTARSSVVAASSPRIAAVDYGRTPDLGRTPRLPDLAIPSPAGSCWFDR
jgi:hypothetical protein